MCYIFGIQTSPVIQSYKSIPNKYLICILSNMIIIYKEPLCIRPCEKRYSVDQVIFWNTKIQTTDNIDVDIQSKVSGEQDEQTLKNVSWY